jgi:hypothetical protein
VASGGPGGRTPRLIVGSSNESQRELNAAAELRVVSGAHGLVAWYESSFSSVAAAAVGARHGARAVSWVEWWTALDTHSAIRRVLYEVCEEGPYLPSVLRACRRLGRRHGFQTAENAAGLSHLSLRADGRDLEQVLGEACAREPIPRKLHARCKARNSSSAAV